MRRLFCLTLVFALAICACKHPVENIHRDHRSPDNYQVKIKIPNEWIEKVRSFDYSRQQQPLLLKEFATIIKPDTIHDPHAEHVKEGYGRVFDPIFTDLDGQKGEELVCMLGWDINASYLCVFKQYDGDWYLIHFEDVDTFYSGPTLSVANNFSKNKVFYCSQVTNHGSGVYNSSYMFYKLIDGKVYKCLELEDEATFEGFYPIVSQSIETSFEFSGDDVDDLNVRYKYNFHFFELVTNHDIPIINGEDGVHYKWDSKNKSYLLDIYNFKDKIDDLTAQKIACFGAFNNDSLFVSAYKDQLGDILKVGTARQKKILREYLAKVQKDAKTNH